MLSPRDYYIASGMIYAAGAYLAIAGHVASVGLFLAGTALGGFQYYRTSRPKE